MVEIQPPYHVHCVWYHYSLHEMSESDQSRPTGGACRVSEGNLKVHLLEVSRKGCCELNGVRPSAWCSWDAVVGVNGWAWIV